MIPPYLDKEIERIEETSIKRFVKEAFTVVPSYFWNIPASASGRFHPLDTLGKEGLVIHTKRVFYLAEELAKVFLLKNEKLDVVRAAALLHDTYKHGLEDKGHSDEEHPFYPRTQFKNFVHLTPYFSQIINAIETHQGRWGREPIKMPHSREEWVLHIADFIASRNFVYLEFNGYTPPDFEEKIASLLREDLEELVKNYLDLKEERARIEKRMEEIKKTLKEMMEKEETNKYITKIGTVRLINNIIYKFKLSTLKPIFKKLGIWDHVVRIDEKKFQEYLNAGIIQLQALEDGVKILEKKSVKIMPRKDLD